MNIHDRFVFIIKEDILPQKNRFMNQKIQYAIRSSEKKKENERVDRKKNIDMNILK